MGYSPFHLMKETIMITILELPFILPGIMNTSQRLKIIKLPNTLLFTIRYLLKVFRIPTRLIL